MRLLAFETSTRRLSVALWQDGQCLTREADLPNSGSEKLLPWVHELMAEAGVGLSQIDAIAFGAGPGGFTGLRLSCGVAQGLGYGLECPLVPVSTLEALALSAGDGKVWTVLDARMNEVYCAAYSVSGDVVSELLSPQCCPPAVSPAPTFAGGIGAGDGFATYGEILLAAKPDLEQVAHTLFPSASAVARLAHRMVRAGNGVSACAAQPIYLRDKVALTTAERLARGGVR